MTTGDMNGRTDGPTAYLLADRSRYVRILGDDCPLLVSRSLDC